MSSASSTTVVTGIVRCESDSFLCVHMKHRPNNTNTRIFSRIFAILHLDRCVPHLCLPHSDSKKCNLTHLTNFTHLLSCPHCVSSSELRSRGMDSTDGREADKPRSPRSQGLHQHRHLEPPRTILDVDYKLLQSGVTILPGGCLNFNIYPLLYTINGKKIITLPNHCFLDS